MCFKLIKHEQWKKEKYWKQPANRGFVWTVLKNKKLGMLAQITLFNVGLHMGGMNQWNGSRMQGKQKSTLASRRQAAESDMASPEEQNDRWCVTGAHWLIDTWHLKAKSMASHARQITWYHRKTQKFVILGFLEQIHHFLHLSAFLRSKKIWTDLKCIFVP